MAITIRPLRADEIDVRIDQINYEYVNNQKTNNPKSGRYLLYKDARCDMNVLDDTFGIFGWQREHKELNGVIYCGISIKDPETGEWVTKWDCGSESNVEKDKGAASDAFKRASVNWRIGRELYTAPTISIEFNDYEKSHGCRINGLRVLDIDYNDGIITKLVVVDARNNVRFSYDSGVVQPSNVKRASSTSSPAGQVDASVSKKIKAVNDCLNASSQLCEYYEAFYTIKKGAWGETHFLSVYDSLLKGGYIKAV